jgi:hypothetical protein
VENVVTITATDHVGNATLVSCTITREPVVIEEEDLTPEEQPVVDPLDVDEDGYLNEDETACGSDPEDSNSVPANYGALQGSPNEYPTDPLDPSYNPQKVKRDEAGAVVGAYLWPDCLNPDDDGDGLPDLWEEQYFGTRTGALPSGDPDIDQVTNLDEYRNGTDPTVAQIAGFSVKVFDPETEQEVYDFWLPGYQKTLKVQATWLGSTATAPAGVWFRLEETSKYPGRAVNDPDPGQTLTNYPSWYEYHGFDFGLSAEPAAPSYAQASGPVEKVELSDDSGSKAVYEIYLRCWDYGGRTKVVVTDSETHPVYLAELWVPQGSGTNGIGAGWDVDNDDATANPVSVNALDANGDMDAIIFDNPSNYTAPVGDDFTNFEEYRGIVYTASIGGSLVHQRLNPYRQDLFVRAEGFEDATGDPYDLPDPNAEYPFAMGLALKNAGIDVHNTTGWGHDATEDYSFFTYYRAGTISSVSGNTVTGGATETGEGTDWSVNWPLYEWEFKLKVDPADGWTPVSYWVDSDTLYLGWDYKYDDGVGGEYEIRASLPHINVLVVWLDRERTGVFTSEDGHIAFRTGSPPNLANLTGARHWAWSTKGLGKKAEKDGSYGPAQILKIPLDHYFDDMAYEKGTVWHNGVWMPPDMSSELKLAPLSMCEDYRDAVEPQDGWSDVSLGILLGNNPNGQWDGDRRLPIDPDCIKNCRYGEGSSEDDSDPTVCIDEQCYGAWLDKGRMSPFDVNHDGYVELPPAADPDAVGADNQNDQHGRPYTKARVLQHTITHEILHVLGGPKHFTVPTGVMYEYSNNWKRDDYLCDWFRSRLRIHNIMR